MTKTIRAKCSAPPATTTARRIKTKDIDELAARLEAVEVHSGSDVDDGPAVQPFRFLDLPYELRLRCYEKLLVLTETVDLDPANARTFNRRLALFLVSHTVHAEASRVFYSQNAFRIFPVHGRFFHTKRPLLARLPPTYRAHLTRLELRLGPGWTKPPKSWIVDERLGLADAPKVHWLKIFVECDPASSEIFEGFRHGAGDGFYTAFCGHILRGLFAQLSGLSKVEFDAYPSVSLASPLLQGLVTETLASKKKILWGPERGWARSDVQLAHPRYKAV